VSFYVRGMKIQPTEVNPNFESFKESKSKIKNGISKK